MDPINSVTVAGCAISISDRLKILSVTLDATLSFDEDIATVVKACNYHLRALRHICRCIAQDIASTIACSIVGSRIDYCNGLLFGASGKAFNRLQRVQNNLARAMFDISIRKLHDSGRRSFDLFASFTGFQFKPGSRIKSRYFALNATNLECRLTYHRCSSSIDQRGVFARRL